MKLADMIRGWVRRRRMVSQAKRLARSMIDKDVCVVCGKPIKGHYEVKFVHDEEVRMVPVYFTDGTYVGMAVAHKNCWPIEKPLEKEADER